MRQGYEKHKELVIGCWFALFAGVYLLGCVLIPKRNLAVIGAEFVPYLLGWLLLFLACCQIVTALSAKRKQAAGDGKQADANVKEASAEEEESQGDWIGVLSTFGLLCMYIVLIEPIGFILSSIVYLFAQMTILVSKNDKRRHGLHLAIAVILPVIAYYVFRSGLNLVLPTGTIFE